jgi:nicotinamidase-related amidase
MHAGSTLFLDVCVQRDLAAGGAWPLLAPADEREIRALFAGAASLGIRQGGIVCLHRDPPQGVPAHCHAESAGSARLAMPAVPALTIDPAQDGGRTFDRAHALYVASGCAAAPDATDAGARAVAHLTAGIRDAVVFGAGLEHGLAHAVDALLQRRIRTHVALDASVAADPAGAQRVVADWKRRTVDVTTAAMVMRLLTRPGAAKV